VTMLYIGTSGYSYKAWRGQFYPPGVPQKDWLAFYAKVYNAVEVNATFYRPFPRQVFAHWHDVTPPDFGFVLKGPKVITHEKLLDDVSEELNEFVSSAGTLQDKLKAMLWQFPASTKIDTLGERLGEFLSALPSGIKQVFEFRHRSFFDEKIYDLLNRFRAGFVINDSPHLVSREVFTGHTMYVRFHGPETLYNSLYSEKQLQAWADKILPQLDQSDVYLFFNNTSAGQALKNATQMRQLLQR
jgi:uncharacterized protein YecE (DUF72 family)